MKLVFGTSIPLMMLLLIAASIYFPAIFVKPHSNFLYVLEDGYFCKGVLHYQYSVQNKKLVNIAIKQSQNTQHPENSKQSEKQFCLQSRELAKLYVYDVDKNESKEITLENAKNLVLNPNPKSSDGFEVASLTYPSISTMASFELPERSSVTHYLKGKSVNKIINLKPDSYNFRFIGWIE